MHDILGKAKAALDSVIPTSSPSPPLPPGMVASYQHLPQPPLPSTADLPSTIQDPTALDILRYRYHHGTNLGSIYVLERWLFPSRFPKKSQGTSELEAVKAWVHEIGEGPTKAMFEKAWAEVVTDQDIKWLKEEAKCTTVRLPIGYYDLSDPSFTRGTPFEPYDYIYSAAWASIRSLISRLRAHSIGVLLDLHALPGGANPHDHSGTNSGVAQFFNSHSNRDMGTRCCEFIAREAKAGLDIVGLQIVNEADWESPNLYEWYDECIQAISAIDSSLPVIISDAWNLQKAVEYALRKNTAYPSIPTCPVLIDTHLYWAFTDKDKQKSPQQIIDEVPAQLTALDGREGSILDRGAVQTIVGEYSCVLTEETWSKAGSSDRQELVRRFGNTQSKRYQERTAGAFFWTWKMDWYPGGEWGFAAQCTPQSSQPHSATLLPSITAPPHALLPAHEICNLLERVSHRRNERMHAAVDQHVSYWHHLHTEKPAEHWRYENGWKIGHQDAYVFFEGRGAEAVGQGNKIGALELWVLKRVRECGMRGDQVWEFEQGLRRGVHDFCSVVGI
ncbi:glycoside hydrolase [Byssothecium circinans]|uniref:Glycoside hydrolase n=1 Tax=Byssothecium circinans TaxID=147558 RepID=A0A6A5U0N1_9PLEO|nr:glycoside hydrolase [Byssothecium circinans]